MYKTKSSQPAEHLYLRKKSLARLLPPLRGCFEHVLPTRERLLVVQTLTCTVSTRKSIPGRKSHVYRRSYSASMCSGKLRDSAGTQWSSSVTEQSRQPDTHRATVSKKSNNTLASERAMYCMQQIYTSVYMLIYTTYILCTRVHCMYTTVCIPGTYIPNILVYTPNNIFVYILEYIIYLYIYIYLPGRARRGWFVWCWLPKSSAKLEACWLRQQAAAAGGEVGRLISQY